MIKSWLVVKERYRETLLLMLLNKFRCLRDKRKLKTRILSWTWSMWDKHLVHSKWINRDSICKIKLITIDQIRATTWIIKSKLIKEWINNSLLIMEEQELISIQSQWIQWWVRSNQILKCSDHLQTINCINNILLPRMHLKWVVLLMNSNIHKLAATFIVKTTLGNIFLKTSTIARSDTAMTKLVFMIDLALSHLWFKMR